MAEETIQRVRYREKQPLSRDDLISDQAYHLAMRRRHHIAHHVWGIVEGLKLKVEQRGGAVVGLRVTAGTAVDGYGRMLVVPQDYVIQSTDLDQVGEVSPRTIDVWLLYARVPQTPPHGARWACGPGQHSRWREEAHLRLTDARGLDPIDPFQPPGVSIADRDFGPHDYPPDDPEKEWLMYLGRVTRSASGLTIDESVTRPYAELRGEAVAAPSGQARLQVGSELAGDDRRFAVTLLDKEGKMVERLAIDRNGKAALHGDLVVTNDLEGNASDLIISQALQYTPLDKAPAAAAPWHMYDVKVKEGETEFNELRIELAHPGEKGDPTRNRLQIGHWENGQFVACLTVRADCTVILHPKEYLNAKGEVKEGPIQPDLEDPRYRDALIAGSHSAMVASAFITNPAFRGELTPGVVITSVTLGNADTVDVNFGSLLQNTGQSRITSVEVRAFLFVNGVLQVEQPILTVDSIQPGSATEFPSHTFAADINPNAPNIIRVTVSALGDGPVGNLVLGRAEATTTWPHIDG